MQRIASLDLVRGVAAFSVAIPHYLILGSSNWPVAETVSALAVEVFFVLSGFVLAPQIISCVKTPGLQHLRVFLLRRWMRTIPPYLIALIAMSLIADKLLSSDFFRYLGYVQNALTQYNTDDYFAVAWSLSVEEWFYVTFPFLLLLCARLICRTDLRFTMSFAICFIIVISLLRTAFGNFSDWDADVRRVTIFRLDSIAAGFLLYLAIEELNHVGIKLKFFGRFSVLIGCLSFAAFGVWIAYLAMTDHYKASEQLFPLAAAGFGASIILVFYGLRDHLGKSGLVFGGCVYLGRISYSVYLFHILMILLLRPHLEGNLLMVQLGTYVVSLMIFCSAFYYYFERPILAARPRYKYAGNAGPYLGTPCPAS